MQGLEHHILHILQPTTLPGFMKRFGLHVYYKCQHLQIVSTVNFPKPIYLASHFIFTLKIIYKQSTLVDTVYIIC